MLRVRVIKTINAMPAGVIPNGAIPNRPETPERNGSSIVENGVGRGIGAGDAASTEPNVVSQAGTLGLRCQVAGAAVDMPTITGPLSINAVFQAAARSSSSTGEP